MTVMTEVADVTVINDVTVVTIIIDVTVVAVLTSSKVVTVGVVDDTILMCCPPMALDCATLNAPRFRVGFLFA